MKVIKKGNTVKEFTCTECGCIFQYSKNDIVSKTRPAIGIPEYPFDVAYYDCIYCPECNEKHILSDTETDCIKECD